MEGRSRQRLLPAERLPRELAHPRYMVSAVAMVGTSNHTLDTAIRMWQRKHKAAENVPVREC